MFPSVFSNDIFVNIGTYLVWIVLSLLLHSIISHSLLYNSFYKKSHVSYYEILNFFVAFLIPTIFVTIFTIPNTIKQGHIEPGLSEQNQFYFPIIFIGLYTLSLIVTILLIGIFAVSIFMIFKSGKFFSKIGKKIKNSIKIGSSTKTSVDNEGNNVFYYRLDDGPSQIIFEYRNIPKYLFLVIKDTAIISICLLIVSLYNDETQRTFTTNLYFFDITLSYSFLLFCVVMWIVAGYHSMKLYKEKYNIKNIKKERLEFLPKISLKSKESVLIIVLFYLFINEIGIFNLDLNHYFLFIFITIMYLYLIFLGCAVSFENWVKKDSNEKMIKELIGIDNLIILDEKNEISINIKEKLSEFDKSFAPEYLEMIRKSIFSIINSPLMIVERNNMKFSFTFNDYILRVNKSDIFKEKIDRDYAIRGLSLLLVSQLFKSPLVTVSKKYRHFDLLLKEHDSKEYIAIETKVGINQKKVDIFSQEFKIYSPKFGPNISKYFLFLFYFSDELTKVSILEKKEGKD